MSPKQNSEKSHSHKCYFKKTKQKDLKLKQKIGINKEINNRKNKF